MNKDRKQAIIEALGDAYNLVSDEIREQEFGPEYYKLSEIRTDVAVALAKVGMIKGEIELR